MWTEGQLATKRWTGIKSLQEGSYSDNPNLQYVTDINDRKATMLRLTIETFPFKFPAKFGGYHADH